ncbi:hypothetical protein Tco_1511669, partial [Tanacetum coccineum]
KKESWGNSEEEDDNENNSEDESDNRDESDDGDINNNDDDDKNVDDEDETDSDRTELDRIKIHVLNQSSTKYNEEEEEEENINDEEKMDEEEEDDAEQLYRDINVNLEFKQEEEDAHVTLTTVHDTQKTDGTMQSSCVSSDFTSKLLNLENPSPTDNEIASLMDTTVRHEKLSSQTLSLYTVQVTAIPEITSTITITIHPPHPFFNPLPQQATPTPTPTTSEATISFPALPNFSSVFKFNDHVTNLEKDLS